MAPALELVLTGDPIDARRAYELGLINRVVPRAELLETAIALAERIAELKEAGKVRSLCLIRHMLADQEAYAERGPEPEPEVRSRVVRG